MLTCEANVLPCAKPTNLCQIKLEGFNQSSRHQEPRLAPRQTSISVGTAQAVEQLRHNRSLGAQGLARKAVECLLRIVSGSDLDWHGSVKSYYHAFKLTAWHLSQARPSMGPALERAMLQVVATADTGIHGVSDVLEAKKILVIACEVTLVDRAARQHRIAHNFVQHIERTHTFDDDRELTLLTLSVSGVKGCMLELVKHFPKARIHLIILESRPSFEGVPMAVCLAQQVKRHLSRATTMSNMSRPIKDRVRITIAADAAVGTLAPEIDYVLLGADTINRSGDVSNKVGSLAAVVTVRELSTKSPETIIVADTDKISRERNGHHVGAVEQYPRAILTDAWSETLDLKNDKRKLDNVEVATPLFETVPAKYITTFVTERGVLGNADIDALASTAAQDWTREFSGF